MIPPNRRIRIVAGAILVVLCVGLVCWSPWKRKESDVVLVSGNIELTEVDMAFKSAGRLATLAVREGDVVKQGQLIAVLDRDEISHRRDSSEAALRSSESRLSQMHTAIAYQSEQVEGQVARSRAEVAQTEAALQELLSGSRQQEIESAQAAEERGATEFLRAQKDWERAQVLYKDEDISTAQFDEFRSRFEAAQAQHKQAKEQLALVREGPRKETIQAARAQLEKAKANLRLAEAARLELKRMYQEEASRQADVRQATALLGVSETQLRDTQIVAPMDGVILVKSAEPGEVLAAGSTVVTLGNLAKPWLRAYINEKDLGRVKLGSQVKVTTDSFPGKTYTGRISFIASEAEFTPKQIQTQEERTKLVYRVKIDLENSAGELKSNMPADGEIPLS